MPYAPTHILLGILLIEIFRKYVIKNNKRFPRYYLLIAAIGAILPDFDFAAFYILSFFGFTVEQLHRTGSHTIFLPLILFIIGFVILKLEIKYPEFRKRHITLPTTFFILSATSLLHIILDALLHGYITPFYPFSGYTLGFNIIYIFPLAWQDYVAPTVDAFLLIFWISWMIFKLKIDEFF